MNNKISFNSGEQEEFYRVLQKRVNQYFTINKISPFANTFMVIKICFFLTGLGGSYLTLLYADTSLSASYVLWLLLGLFTAFTGVNICHDAIHGAISSNKTINTLLGYLLNVAGANAYLWNITHNIQHHTFTNIDGYDGDIESVPIVKLSPHKKHLSINRFQYIYTFFFYCFTSLLWVFYKDFRGFSKTNFGNYVRKTHSVKEFLIMIFFKIVYFTLFLVLPLLLIDHLWWQILIGFTLMHFVEGFCLAIIIQLAHMVESVEFPLPDNSGKIDNSWAIHQLSTTVDYARKNDIVGFFFGGLNFHIEHHLFQKICHVHHKPISEIVKKTANEYNVPYNEYPGLFDALSSHVRFLKRMGQKP